MRKNAERILYVTGQSYTTVIGCILTPSNRFEWWRVRRKPDGCGG